MLYYLAPLDNFLELNEDVTYCRFVDDIVIVGTDKKKLLKLMEPIRDIVQSNGCRLNEKKFYFQHYSKGVEFLGSHLKFGRAHLNNKTIYRMMCKIRFLNGVKNKAEYLDKFQSSMNSYFGILKRRTNHKVIWRVCTHYLDREWFEYFHTNPKRKCFQKIKNPAYKGRVFLFCFTLFKSSSSQNNSVKPCSFLPRGNLPSLTQLSKVALLICKYLQA